jgi:copper(I)-binding protein
MRMVALDPVVVGARDSLALRPGGEHLMFHRAGAAWPADSLRLTLVFARAGSLQVALPVRPIGQETQ